MNKIAFESIEKELTVSDFTRVIAGLADHGALVVSDIPELWRDVFYSKGFCEYACYQDYWIDALVLPKNLYGESMTLRPDECAAASEVSIACKNQSRGFGGESPDWFASWLRGMDDLQNAAVLIHKKDGRIDGISYAATYAHNSEKGAVVWVRMLAVHPESQRRGIGKQLLMQTLAYGAARGAKRAFLHADTKNAAAIKIYTEAGFLPREGEIQVDMIWEENT